MKNKPSQIYFEKIFSNKPIKWDKINLPPMKVTCNTYLQCFEYEILNNVFYLNKKLYTFKTTDSPICSFCKTGNETTLLVFHSCTLNSQLWSQLQLFLES